MSVQENALPKTLAGPNEVVPTQTVADKNITHFSDDTHGDQAIPIGRVDTPISNFLDIPGSDSIIQFLQRPTVLTSGNISTADTTTIYSVDPFLALVSGAKAPKLNGIYGIRADVRITLNLNATRFQAGRYILAFIPSGGPPITSAAFLAKSRAHATTLVNITQLPHVEIDVATQSHVELLLPWQSVVPFFVNLSTYPVGFGRLFLYPYAALAAGGGDTTAGYTLWASFENIQLTGSTYTQSGRAAAIEANKAGIGPVARTLGRISTAASIIGEFPLLTPLAKQVSWSSDILKRAANVFGWSKPVESSASMGVRIHPLKHFENADGANTAKSLGALSTNALIASPLNNASAVDEMSIDFVKQIYSYAYSFSWTAAATTGTSLQTFIVNPFQGTTYGVGYVFPPLSYLATMFRLWRGSMKWRFKIVKNEFYSGRLAIYYEPNYNASTTSVGIGPSEFSQRLIVDIRDTAEFEVFTPYMSPMMYTDVGTGIGRLYVRVIDPLVAPDTVAQNVTVLVEFAGGPDFEFAAPQDLGYEVWSPFVTQSGRAYKNDVSVWLGTPTEKSSIVPAEISIGEKIESLRQLWKLPTKLMPTSLFSDAVTFTINQISYIVPSMLNIVTQPTSITTALSRNFFYSDRYDVIAAMYVFNTGSHRITFADCTKGMYEISVSYGSSRRLMTNGVSLTLGGITTRTHTDGLKFEPTDVIVPPYQVTMGRSTIAHSHNTGGTAIAGTSAYLAAGTLSVVARSGTTLADVYRTPCDDSNCWGFLSCPALVFKTQT